MTRANKLYASLSICLASGHQKCSQQHLLTGVSHSDWGKRGRNHGWRRISTHFAVQIKNFPPPTICGFILWRELLTRSSKHWCLKQFDFNWTVSAFELPSINTCLSIKSEYRRFFSSENFLRLVISRNHTIFARNFPRPLQRQWRRLMAIGKWNENYCQLRLPQEKIAGRQGGTSGWLQPSGKSVAGATSKIDLAIMKP